MSFLTSKYPILSFKTALLLALASAKCVSDLHAFSVHSACLQFMSGDAGVVLKPNPAFMPKIVKAIIPLELRAFYPPTFASSEQQKWNALCPECDLRIYTERTRGFRESDQLFVSWMNPRTGKPITKPEVLCPSNYMHTQQGECQLPGLYLKESHYRIFVKRRVGPHHIHLQGSINWMLQLRLPHMQYRS